MKNIFKRTTKEYTVYEYHTYGGGCCEVCTTKDLSKAEELVKLFTEVAEKNNDPVEYGIC